MFERDEIPGGDADLLADSCEAEGEDIAADCGGTIREFEAGAKKRSCVSGES